MLEETWRVTVLFNLLFVFWSSHYVVNGIRHPNENMRKKEVTPTFEIEYAWLSDYDGGYIANFKVPVHLEVPRWNMALLFPERVYNISLWQATFLELTPDGRVVYCKQTRYNGHQWPGNELKQRFLLRFNITPGVDYNGYSGPKPDIVFLDKVFMPDRDTDYGHNMKTEDFKMYSKTRSIYFRKPKLFTVPFTTTTPTTTPKPTTTQYNPFINTGREEQYRDLFQRPMFWFVDGANETRPITTTTTAISTTTTRPGGWFQFSDKSTTQPPKPTLSAIDCNESRKKKEKNCKEKGRPMKRCYLPLCDGQRFKALQCSKHSGFCWCVDVRTGVRKSRLVKYRNSEKLNCFKGDLSRTTTVPTTTTTYYFTTTQPYIPDDFNIKAENGRPVFAPRNTYAYPEIIFNSHLFYEAQRSGQLPSNKRVSWRKSAHTRDGFECRQDLSGGYYQSGGYIKFGFPMAFSVTQLAWSYLEAEHAYKASWQTKFLKDTLKWATDYFIKAHTGKFEFYGQVGDPVYENNLWTRPEDMKNVRRPCYKITSRSPGSDLASETAAALAATAAVWIETGSKRSDPYVKSLIKHAEELFHFGDKYRGVYHMSIRAAANSYASSGYQDELAWAAMWLYIATGHEKYLANAKTKYFQFSLFKQETEFSWDRKAVGVQLLLAKYTKSRVYFNPVIQFCDSVMPDGVTQYTPYGLLFISKWGPLRYALNAGFICMTASKLNMLSNAKKVKYRKFGEDQIDYVLGKTGKSYVIGFGAKYPTQPHHRASSCSLVGVCGQKQFESHKSNPQILLGALVGGPDERDIWMDDRTNTMSNSVSLDFNSALQSAVAVLRQFQIDYKAWFDSQWREKST